MRALVILSAFMLIVVLILGYICGEQDKLIKELQQTTEFKFEWIEPIPFERFLEIDILGEKTFIPIDNEGRVTWNTPR